MPKATKSSRQIAHFEDGELWCTADATPPVSPGGWYFRLRDTPVGWIGPFPTAEAATVAPQGGDPLATARRRLEEWARATAEPGAEPPVEAVPVVLRLIVLPAADAAAFIQRARNRHPPTPATNRC